MNEAMIDLFTPRDAPPASVPADICTLFERFALEVAAAGFKRYSADALLHRIRWHEQIERGNREFKCNDHYTAPLARWFLAKHPELKGFFELRSSRHDAAA